MIRIFAGVSLLALAATPALGQTLADLEPLVAATTRPATGTALARRQIAGGNLLEALATLERIILNHPESDEARMLHAGVMCRLDDRTGAMVELDALRNRQISEALRTEANDACASGRRR